MRLISNFRSFLRSSLLGCTCATLMLSVVALPLVAPLTGCTGSDVQKTVSQLTQTLGDSVAQVASLEGNATLSATLLKDTNAAIIAINGWKNGSAVDDVIEGLGILSDDLSLIPGTSQYAPLIDLAIGTVQSLLTLIPAKVTVGDVTKATLTRHAGNPRITLALQHRAEKGATPPQSRAQYVKQWNGIVEAHPELHLAPLAA
jgi:hypothetical protein